METLSYLTNLSDAEWHLLEPLLPPPARTGLRLAPAACCLLPADWPPWKAVFHYYRTWRRDGTWERIHRLLRQRLRIRLGRDPEPSAGSVDSQSIKTTGVGGERG